MQMDFIQIIIALIVVWITFKVLRILTSTKYFFDSKHLVFSKGIHDYWSYEPGSVPPPYPNTWYPIVQSDELKKGQVKPLYVLEKNLVVFRAMSGKAHILDAFCPHLGAHIGVGGSVVGEDVRCPFHSWTFSGEGLCTSVPGLQASNIPKAKIKRWTTIERNGWVYIWYHINDHEPDWEPKESAFLTKSTKCLENRQIFNCLLVDFLANAFDVAHLSAIHKVISPFSSLQTLRKEKFYYFIEKIFHFDYDEYKAVCPTNSDQDKRQASGRLIITPVLFGFHLSKFKLQFEFEVCPPVLINIITAPLFGTKICIMFNCVPEAPMRQILISHIYYSTGSFMSKILSRIFSHLAIAIEEADQIILSNKLILKNPYFTKVDKYQEMYFRWIKDNFYNKE